MPQFSCSTHIVYPLCSLGGHRNAEVRYGQGWGLDPHLLFLCFAGWQGSPSFPNLDPPGGGGDKASGCFYSESPT